MKNKTKNSKGGIIFGIVFLLWFFASIGGLIYCSSNELGALSAGIFGQYFLVFGIIAFVSGIKSKDFNPIVLLFPLIGICVIIGAIIYQFGSKEQIDALMGLMPYGILLIFFIIGVGLLIYAYRISIAKIRRCTYPIDAVCIDVKTRFRHKEGKSYCPVYMIEYQGKVIELCNEIYSNINKMKAGDTQRIIINPDNPKDFYEIKQMRILTVFFLIMGLIFMGVPVFTVYMMTCNW